jgi:hypothetical protein
LLLEEEEEEDMAAVVLVVFSLEQALYLIKITALL